MTSTEHRTAAIILLDCMEGTAGSVLADADKRKRFADSAKGLLELAREAEIPVIRVDVEFRPDHPEIAASNAYFSGVKQAGRLVAGSGQTDPMVELKSDVATAVRVVKRRIGGFSGSDLEWVLRGMGRTHLILAGLVTRGAVLSTACEAADNDYRVTVISDACSDPDPEVHRVLIESVLPLRASVKTTADLKSQLGK